MNNVTGNKSGTQPYHPHGINCTMEKNLFVQYCSACNEQAGIDSVTVEFRQNKTGKHISKYCFCLRCKTLLQSLLDEGED